jgi:hypothetical protein
MKLLTWLLFVPALMGRTDDDKIPQLIESLSDPSIETRESAMQSLIELGEPALTALRKAATNEDSEVRERAECALVEIRRRTKLRSLYRERKPFALRCEGTTVDEALREITQKTGVRFQTDNGAGREKVSLDLSDATLMQALDTLCRESRELEWSFSGQDQVRLKAQPFLPKPSSYDGGFKVAVKRVEVYRCSNFRDSNGMLWIFLEAISEPGIQISGTPVFRVTQVVDETGNELTSCADGSNVPPPLPGGSIVARDFAGTMDSRPFAFTNLSRFARKLSRVRGKVSFCFALGATDILLEDLPQGSTSTVGDLSVQVNDSYNGSIQVMLTRSGDLPAPAQLFNLAAVTVTDTDGTEYHPSLSLDVQNFYRVGNSASFSIWFNRTSPMAAKSVRLTVVNDFYEKSVPFEFTNVPLP